jgi:hypothetical protein
MNVTYLNIRDRAIAQIKQAFAGQPNIHIAAHPKVKDLLQAGAYPEGSIAFTHALLSSLTGEPAIIINEMVPEDWADALVILSRTYQRFTGLINLFDKKEESGNPTKADIPPGNSSRSSGGSPGN